MRAIKDSDLEFSTLRKVTRESVTCRDEDWAELKKRRLFDRVFITKAFWIATLLLELISVTNTALERGTA